MLGKRVRELRIDKKWSQEEFAHVSGLHRTYIGQIERGEKNVSFDNLVKIATVLEVTASELLSVLDNQTGAGPGATRGRTARQRGNRFTDQGHEIQKLLAQLKHQRSALDRTLARLEELVASAHSA